MDTTTAKGCRKTRPPSGQRAERNGNPFPYEFDNESLSRIKSTWCGCNRQRRFSPRIIKTWRPEMGPHSVWMQGDEDEERCINLIRKWISKKSWFTFLECNSDHTKIGIGFVNDTYQSRANRFEYRKAVYGCKKSRSAIEGMWWFIKKRNVASDRGAVGGWLQFNSVLHESGQKC